MLPKSLQSHLQEIGITIQNSQPISGGDINHAALLDCVDQRQFFVKFNNTKVASEMLSTEAKGLQVLQAAQAIRIPKIITQGQTPDGIAFLLLEYIQSGSRRSTFWQQFGASLAALHRNTSPQFGLDHSNFIGSLPQSNQWRDTWALFYAEERLLPQMQLARTAKLLDSNDEKRLHSLCQQLHSICPTEAPSLIHGDLWSGNFLCDARGGPVLIDPAVAYAHREMDLAMSRLFGGFDAVFYRAYDEAWPLEPGFEQRMEIYQLYYLLVHVNLFGRSYVPAVRSVLQQF
ncbi:fructosamine kinase family protein [Haliscomenobacter sp.]|uniref:fructosamine kinase family protein n=1 Tax=Haliscomenobacter sp. TaxID=2717303 RepID=UPI003BAC5D2A